MSDALLRDQAAALAKSKPDQALVKARSIKGPWYRAQALACVARYLPKNAVQIANESSKAARECDDAYKRVAARAWEIAALAEVGSVKQARKSLGEALKDSDEIVPCASRAEALMLLLAAASLINSKEVNQVHDKLKSACSADKHWRSKRALRNAELVRDGSVEPRRFFW